MREPSEMVTASRMQNMVEIRKKNTYFVTILLFRILKCSKTSDFLKCILVFLVYCVQ